MLNDSKAWEAAFEQWLADKSPHTQRAYRRAWDDLLAYSGKAPWDIKEGDVRAWIEDLAQRPLDRCVARRRQRRGQRSGKQGKGLSDSTIALWLAAVSSLYQFATEYRVRSEVGGESPLHNHNPVAAVQRPRQGFSPQADYLEPMQLRRLLAAIPRHTLQGLRDYALFLGYILKGHRNSEWRRLRWGDIQVRGREIRYAFGGGQGATHKMPPPLWDALYAYLQEAGRLETICDTDYIFTPLTDRATRLKHVDPSSWDRNRAISAREVRRLLKKYARRAGLPEAGIHVDVLRNSAVMLEARAGANLQEISEFLGHSCLSTTVASMARINQSEGPTWQEKMRYLHLD